MARIGSPPCSSLTVCLVFPISGISAQTGSVFFITPSTRGLHRIKKALRPCAKLPAALAVSSILMILSLAVEPLVYGTDWFVSPDGSDLASGKSSVPGRVGRDGPFASLARAREAVREQLVLGAVDQQTVHVRGGTYELAGAFKLEERDSGSAERPVVWKAFGEEKPRITGSIRLSRWEPWKGSIFRAPLGKRAASQGGVRQLIFEGQRQTLARYPNADPARPAEGGWAFAQGKSWPMYAEIPGEDKKTLEVAPSDWREWADPTRVELVVFPRFNWWNSRSRVRSVDRASGIVSLVDECSYSIRKGDRYFFQNALEELDSPGEWYADESAAVIYFWPPQGKAPEGAEVVVAQSLLTIDSGAHDIVWQGFEFEGCNGTAISLNKTARCVVKGNEIRNVGEWNGNAVSISKGESNRIAGNIIGYVGRTAIAISGGSIATLSAANNTAEDNHIHHFGVYFKQGVGIDLGDVGNSALHNEIHDGPRFGIMHRGNKNLIGWNHIHHVCLETEDTGAIYSGGRDWITPRGTRIFYNFIHDVPGFSMHEGKVLSPHFAWGIYLDDNSGGVDVHGNVVTRCGRGGLHGHAARDCVVTNNIFVGNKDWQVDFHGWTVQQSFWEKHLPSMVRGYESVAQNSEWQKMRGMDLHPTKVPLPNGLTMRGNLFFQNLVISDTSEVPVISILRVPFTHNKFDYNLYWAAGSQVRTGFVSAGPDQGANLLEAFSGEDGGMPHSWRWSSKPAGNPQVILSKSPGQARVSLKSDPNSDSKLQMIVAGPEMDLTPGATYRLRLRAKSSSHSKVAIGVHSFISKVYFWMTPGGIFETGNEWRDYELVFEVPSRGGAGWHEQMKRFSPRVAWNLGGQVLEIESMSLQEALPRSQWESWRANGVDTNSLVADPLWEDIGKFTLRPDSPAWKIGFQRIPIESIGPQSR